MSSQACNTAGYLAAEIIRASLSKVVSDYNAGQTTVNIVLGLASLIPGLGIVADLAIGAGLVLNNAIAGAGTGPYTTALGDATLWARVSCAIYLAIVTVGYTDGSNFGAVHDALAAVTYTDAGVIATIAAYWNALGLTGVQAAQAAGALYVGDCSACVTPSGISIQDWQGFGTTYDGGHPAPLLNPNIGEAHTFAAAPRAAGGGTVYSFRMDFANLGGTAYAPQKIALTMSGCTPITFSNAGDAQSTEGGEVFLGAGETLAINPDWHYKMIQQTSSTPFTGTIVIRA